LIEPLHILLNRRRRLRMALLLGGLLLGGLLEMISIGSIPAFVALLVAPERLFTLLPENDLTIGMVNMEPATLVFTGALFLAGLFFVKNLYLAGLIYAEQRLIRDVNITVSLRLLRAYLYAPYVFHLQHNPAKLIRKITYDSVQAVQVISGAMRIMRECLVLLVVFALLMLMDPLVSLAIFLLLGATTSVFYLRVRQTLAARGRLEQQHRAAQLKAVNQGLGAIKDAKVMGREASILKEYEQETRGLQRQQLYLRVVSEFPKLFLEATAISAVLVVSVIFMLLERPAQEMLPVLTLLAVAVVRMIPAFNGISWVLSSMRFQLPCLETVCRELTRLQDPAGEQELNNEPNTAADADRQPLQKAISLENVWFRYPEAADETLRGISLTIAAGESVALVGPSGSGKSTLVDIILGLLSPTAGQVLVDGEDIHNRLASWQRQIGYIPQDIYLLDDTIRRNIAFGLDNQEIDEVAVNEAIRAAQLEEFVATLSLGLDTVIGNRGVRLSGGQRQRVGIARALYHKPKVLVMDEATSALDNDTEREVIVAINRLRGELTLIMVAHRLTTVEGCDRVYTLSSGALFYGDTADNPVG